MSLKKLITITEQGVNSGPTYSVSTSTDGNTWVFLTNVTLPSLGSTATVTVPGGTILVKLTSLGVCDTSVIKVIPNSLGGDFNIDFSYLDFSVY